MLAAIDSVLAKLGSDKSKLLSATVYLSNIGNFAAMNEAWDAWVSGENLRCAEGAMALRSRNCWWR